MMKKFFFLLCLVGYSAVYGYGYTFHNRTPYTLSIRIFKGSFPGCDNPQDATIQSGSAYTFNTGGCCLNDVRIIPSEYDYMVEFRPDEPKGELSMGGTMSWQGYRPRCQDYEGTLYESSRVPRTFRLQEGKPS